MGKGHFCHLPKYCKLLFIGTVFTILEFIPWKITKFPFHRHIAHLCSLHIGWELLKTNNGKVACATLYRFTNEILRKRKEIALIYFTYFTQLAIFKKLLSWYCKLQFSWYFIYFSHMLGNSAFLTCQSCPN